MIDRRALLAGMAAGGWSGMVSAPASASGGVAGTIPSSYEVPLWPEGVPGAAGVAAEEWIDERQHRLGPQDKVARNITNPRLTVFPAAKPNGMGLLILPGGGYRGVGYQLVGHKAAEFYNAHGITCYVLVYRLPGDGWAAGAEASLQDAQRALRIAMHESLSLGGDAEKLVVLGDSAGGHLGAWLAYDTARQTYDAVDSVDDQPLSVAALGLLYPVISMTAPFAHEGVKRLFSETSPDGMLERYSVETLVGEESPPTFIVHCNDDPVVSSEHSLLLNRTLSEHSVPTDLHIFAQGGHGFGYILPENMPASIWPTLFLKWLSGYDTHL